LISHSFLSTSIFKADTLAASFRSFLLNTRTNLSRSLLVDKKKPPVGSSSFSMADCSRLVFVGYGFGKECLL